MSLFWMQSVMGFLFFTVWCLIGQVVMDQRRSQRYHRGGRVLRHSIFHNRSPHSNAGDPLVVGGERRVGEQIGAT